MSASRRRGSRRPAVVGDNSNGYVETDPTGRYGRFDEVLGRGAMKCVYRGFDEERGMEVAWNQASLCDVLRTPDAVQRMYSEVQLLRTLRHESIISIHASWVDVPNRAFNFITELFSSGTLRSYRLRYPRVSLRAVRSWARQVLAGLAYLHSRGVIHRDLKCDNLFVNGHRGQVKIGDLGLAAALPGAAARRARSVVGTPEFMAPEMYDEDYDERVDVYSFGMCMLEMLTLEFPYAECSNPAQIYKKVTAGKLPDAFYRLKDDDARRFIGRCLVSASSRPAAAELLRDPFLLDDPSPPRPLLPPADVPPLLFTSSSNNASDGSSSSSLLSDDHERGDEPPRTERPPNNMTITGKLNAEEDTIFLKVQIADETGHVRNIYFPFDMASDTAMEVATEMVKELDITDRDPEEIAAMIEQEIDRLLPGREQHEYSYANSDDDENPPFYYLSSSPTWTSSGGFSGPHGGGWSKDHGCYAFIDDDDMSSVHSGKYSALHYVSGDEQDDDKAQQQQQQAPPNKEEEDEEQVGRPTTRFGPEGTSSTRSSGRADAAHHQQQLLQPHAPAADAAHHRRAARPRRRGEEGDRRGRMSRNRSMVDMRSQLLHRTLVEELNRRMFFNTVAAVENIGFRAPPGYGSSSSSRGRGRRSKDDDKNQRYYML